MPSEEHIQYVPESAAVEVRGVIYAAIAALVLLAGAIVGLYAVYDHAVPIKTLSSPQQSPQPQVVTSQVEIAERQRLAAEQYRLLGTWGWADAQHTLVQIPIERAMQLLAQKGGDAYEPLLPPQPALSSPAAGAENAMTPTAQPKTAHPPDEKRP